MGCYFSNMCVLNQFQGSYHRASRWQLSFPARWQGWFQQDPAGKLLGRLTVYQRVGGLSPTRSGKQGWRNQLSVLSVLSICCPGQETVSSWLVRGQVKKILYLCVYFQMVAAKIKSLQTYSYFISEIRIIVKVLHNVKHESCS